MIEKYLYNSTELSNLGEQYRQERKNIYNDSRHN